MTRPTQMNSASSRSHSILTVTVETKEMVNDSIVLKTSKINFVDLAGSEKLKQTGAVGDRRSEGSYINQSLTALNKVIMALEQKKNKNGAYVPYRDSILTQLLKDSLGGNSHTIIVGTINATNEFIKETISTLNFLEGAKQIKNYKKTNEKIEGNEQKLR
jgi:kinesin family member 15